MNNQITKTEVIELIALIPQKKKANRIEAVDNAIKGISSYFGSNCIVATKQISNLSLNIEKKRTKQQIIKSLLKELFVRGLIEGTLDAKGNYVSSCPSGRKVVRRGRVATQLRHNDFDSFEVLMREFQKGREYWKLDTGNSFYYQKEITLIPQIKFK